MPAGRRGGRAAEEDEDADDDAMDQQSNESDSDDADGGDDEERTRCICGRSEDDGDMIQCEKCLVWQHVACMNLGHLDLQALTYFCEQCRPDLHEQWAAEAYVRAEVGVGCIKDPQWRH